MLEAWIDFEVGRRWRVVTGAEPEPDEGNGMLYDKFLGEMESTCIM